MEPFKFGYTLQNLRQIPQASPPVTQTARTLPQTTQNQLTGQLVHSLSQNWNVPHVTSPLTQDEQEFLRTHTIYDLVANDTPKSPILAFIVEAVKFAATQAFKLGLKELLKPSQAKLGAPSGKKAPSSREEKAEEDVKIEASSKDNHTVKGEANQQGTKATEPVDNLPEMDKPDDSDNGSCRASEDPSDKKMESVLKKIITKKAYKMVKDEVKERLQNLSGNIADNRAANEILKGASFSKAEKVFEDTMAADQAFYKNMGRAAGAAFKAASFANAVEEKGWDEAFTSAIRDLIIDGFSKLSSKGAAAVIGATNPAAASAFIATILVGTLAPTDTAPDWHDTRPFKK